MAYCRTMKLPLTTQFGLHRYSLPMSMHLRNLTIEAGSAPSAEELLRFLRAALRRIDIIGDPHKLRVGNVFFARIRYYLPNIETISGVFYTVQGIYLLCFVVNLETYSTAAI